MVLKRGFPFLILVSVRSEREAPLGNRIELIPYVRGNFLKVTAIIYAFRNLLRLLKKALGEIPHGQFSLSLLRRWVSERDFRLVLCGVRSAILFVSTCFPPL